MKTVSIIAGALFLTLAIGGMVMWAYGFAELKEWLLNPVPVFFELKNDTLQVPSRWLALGIIAIPFGCLAVGIWLIQPLFERGAERKG